MINNSIAEGFGNKNKNRRKEFLSELINTTIKDKKIMNTISRIESEYEKNFNSLCQAVGMVAINWASAEQTLELIIAILYRSTEGNKLIRKIPKNFSEKIKYLDKCSNSLNLLNNLKFDINNLSSEFNRLSLRRHELIHGALSNIEMIDGAFHFIKLDIIDDYHHVIKVRLEINAYPVLINELVKLGSLANSLGLKISDLFRND